MRPFNLFTGQADMVFLVSNLTDRMLGEGRGILLLGVDKTLGQAIFWAKHRTFENRELRFSRSLKSETFDQRSISPGKGGCGLFTNGFPGQPRRDGVVS